MNQKPSKGPSPTVKNNTWKFKESVIPISKRLNRNQRFYSKKLPLAEAKQESIEQIINGLAQHPLALYPHLEETLPPDVFFIDFLILNTIVKILTLFLKILSFLRLY